MTSSMLAGEKRWASARRGGMTVLGKVAVPKPINLPSQRLENHGLDPNVEIVPKGTLSWGNRSSSSTPNAWGSTAVSPSADGGTTSPGHVSGRPSSASGSRPSTAGSDRNLEPIANAWSQNSRPSSASGVLTSNQTAPTSLRPRSADTRPGSSQLSRFAESSSDNAVAWGPNRASEKLGLISSRKDGFSLDSGDFPTLGTEKDYSKKGNSQEDGFNGRPSSSSGEAAALEKEETVISPVGDISVNVTNESSNTWRRDGPQHVDDVPQHAFEKWQADSSPPYLNTTIPPQHFDAWHGVPINPPAEAWFRGPPGGLPYATPLGHGGFPIEPFPFYGPQIPPAVLSNSQQIPPPGAGPRGNYPKNGDLYRPHISEAYMRPGLPMRPGFFPGPMAYDGYYGPPMAFHNPNERDLPLMGMVARPSFSNRYPGENVPDHVETHARAGIHSTMGKPRLSEKVESGKREHSSGPFRVILKQQDVSDEKHREDKLEHAIPLSVPIIGRGDKSRSSSQKYEWGLEEESVDEDIFAGGPHGIAYSKDYDKHGSNTSNKVKVDLHENRGKTKAASGGTVDILENAALAFSQAPQAVVTAQKDPMLIQKIESLNAKARTPDGRPVAVPFPGREGQKTKSHVVDTKDKVFMRESGGAATQCFDANHATGSYMRASSDVGSSTADKILQPVAPAGVAISRGVGHGVQVKHDHRGKRFNTQVADGWQKKPVAPEYTSAVSAANSEPNPRVQVHGCLPSEEGAEKSGVNLPGKYEGESLMQIFDAGDCQEQRAKMREIAKQRAIQLQKEEEERTREQKAKALAKLEELNKRTQAIDGSNQKSDRAPPSGPDCAVLLEREERKVPAEEVIVASKSETSPVLVSKPSAQVKDAVAVKEATDLSKDDLLPSSGGAETVVPHVRPLPSKQDPGATFAAGHKEHVSQVGDSSGFRNKRINKPKQNNLSAKTLPEKSIPRGPTEKSDDHVDVVVNDVPSTKVVAEASSGCESSLPVNSNTIAESTQQKRKSRSTKNKHKTDSVPSRAASPSAPPVQTHSGEVSCKTRKPDLEVELDPASIPLRTGAQHAIQAPESSLPCEEANGRANNQWKSQQSRKIPRNQQASKPADKLHSNDGFVWAPVRPLNKPSEEASDKIVHSTVVASTKSDNIVLSNQKNKRAEMERYVPKPVAKELAQQGILQQSVTSSVNQTPSANTAGRVQSVTPSINRTPAGNTAGRVDSVEAVKSVEKSQHNNSSAGHIASTAETRNGDDKKKKQPKAHGSWRQRGSAEPATVQSLLDGSSTPDSAKNVHETLEQRTVADVSSIEAQMKSNDDRKLSDGKDTAGKSDMETRVVKDQGATGRGKRPSSKGNRNHGHIDADSGDIDKSFPQTMSSEVAGLTEKSTAAKENHGVRERQTSQWQPKSQVYTVNNQKGKRPSGGEKVSAEVGPRKDLPSQDRLLPPNDQSVSEEKNVVSVSNTGNQESRRESKVAPFKGRPYSPNQSSHKHVPGSQNNQRFPSGYRKFENQNYRGGRDHDFRDDWNSAGHDNRQQSSSFNRERHGHNANYEYQPVTQLDSNRSNNFEGSSDGSHGRGSTRYKERNQVHSRRGGGNSYGRQSVDAN